MKQFLVALAICAFPALAHAVDPSPTVIVSQAYQSSMTCMAINISSAGTQAASYSVTPSTQTLWRSISVQNQSSTINMYCSDMPNLSTPTASGFASTIGWEIPGNTSPQSANFYLVPGMAFYCMNDSTSSTNRAIVCKGR